MSTFGYGLTKYKYATHESALKAIQEKEKKIQRLLKHQNELKTWTPEWAIKKERKPRVKKIVGEIKKEEKAEIKSIATEAKKATRAVKSETKRAIKRVKEEGAPEGKTLKRQRASGRRVGAVLNSP